MRRVHARRVQTLEPGPVALISTRRGITTSTGGDRSHPRERLANGGTSDIGKPRRNGCKGALRLDRREIRGDRVRGESKRSSHVGRILDVPEVYRPLAPSQLGDQRFHTVHAHTDA